MVAGSNREDREEKKRSGGREPRMIDEQDTSYWSACVHSKRRGPGAPGADAKRLTLLDVNVLYYG